jgi:hypothetical protein
MKIDMMLMGMAHLGKDELNERILGRSGRSYGGLPIQKMQCMPTLIREGRGFERRNGFVGRLVRRGEMPMHRPEVTARVAAGGVTIASVFESHQGGRVMVSP